MGGGMQASVSVQEAVELVQELLAECSVFQGRLPKTISFKGLQQRLDSVQTAVQLCQEMMGIEGAVSLLGSGPRGMPLLPFPHSPSNPLLPPFSCARRYWALRG